MEQEFLHTALGRFRLIALLEGVSFLVLLCIAMPLKYAAGYPDAVKYTGWVHGVLFVLYTFLLLLVWKQYNWRFSKVIVAFAASLIPFGTFILDRSIKKETASVK
jgi:integral membrane protein